ncbi:MAG: helix-turn-helix transcriptional regulator [Bacteroidales bacterium]|nr:helix-turn-helix transcriptional regulator [Bacteroidales bacterium]
MDINTLDRIKQIIEESSFNQKEFCEHCHISPSTLSSVLKGKGGVTLPLLISINKAFPQYSLDWLVKGEGGLVSFSPVESIDEPISRSDMPTQPPRVAPLDLKPQSPQMALPFSESVEATSSHSSLLNSVELPLQMTSDRSELVKNKELPPRQVVEIRVFFDDGTYQVLAPKA